MELNLKAMTTEKRNQNTMNLDTMSPMEILTVMNQEDEKVPQAIGKVLPEIAKCVELASTAIRSGGRIIYMGAGTSGRLGVLDAVECPPTFGVAPGTVIGLVAGGATAFDRPIEDAEDSMDEGRKDLLQTSLKPEDIVIGIAVVCDKLNTFEGNRFHITYVRNRFKGNCSKVLTCSACVNTTHFHKSNGVNIC